MNLLEKMQAMTESLDAKELLAQADKETVEDNTDNETMGEMYKDYIIVSAGDDVKGISIKGISVIKNSSVENVKRIIDKTIKSRIERYINKYGRYNKNPNPYLEIIELFDSEKDFLKVYNKVAKEETYKVKICWTYQEEWEVDEDDFEEGEDYDSTFSRDKDIWEDIASHLWEEYDADEVAPGRVWIDCIGDREWEEVDKLLNTENSKLEISEIDTEYGPDGSLYRPTKNRNLEEW